MEISYGICRTKCTGSGEMEVRDAGENYTTSLRSWNCTPFCRIRGILPRHPDATGGGTAKNAGECATDRPSVKNSAGSQNPPGSASWQMSADNCRPRSSGPAAGIPTAQDQTHPAAVPSSRDATTCGPNGKPEAQDAFQAPGQESFCPLRSIRRSESVYIRQVHAYSLHYSTAS